MSYKTLIFERVGRVARLTINRPERLNAINRAAIEEIPDGGFQCVVRSAYRCLVPRRMVGAWQHGGLWIDVGTPASYLRANLEVLGGRVSVPLDPWTRGARGPGGSWVGPGAVIEGQVERCVIGAGAVVPEGVWLVDTVVWDGVVVPGSLVEEREQGRIESAIIYDRGQILEVETTS